MKAVGGRLSYKITLFYQTINNLIHITIITLGKAFPKVIYAGVLPPNAMTAKEFPKDLALYPSVMSSL